MFAGLVLKESYSKEIQKDLEEKGFKLVFKHPTIEEFIGVQKKHIDRNDFNDIPYIYEVNNITEENVKYPFVSRFPVIDGILTLDRNNPVHVAFFNDDDE